MRLSQGGECLLYVGYKTSRLGWAPMSVRGISTGSELGVGRLRQVQPVLFCPPAIAPQVWFLLGRQASTHNVAAGTKGSPARCQTQHKVARTLDERTLIGFLFHLNWQRATPPHSDCHGPMETGPAGVRPSHGNTE